MKDCEVARHGAKNMTTYTSVKPTSSTRRTLQQEGQDQHFDVGRLVAHTGCTANFHTIPKIPVAGFPVFQVFHSKNQVTTKKKLMGVFFLCD